MCFSPAQAYQIIPLQNYFQFSLGIQIVRIAFSNLPHLQWHMGKKRGEIGYMLEYSHVSSVVG